MKPSLLIVGLVALVAYAINPYLIYGAVAGWLAYQAYLLYYFRSAKFLRLKGNLERHVADCNALNHHIAELKSAYSGVQAQNLGEATLADRSIYNFKRPEWEKSVKSRWVHNCSATVAKNAHNQPFRYLCKYFNIPTTQETLEHLEFALNSFAAAEEGKHLLKTERDEVLAGVESSIPYPVRQFSRERLIRQLGFEPVELSDLYFPVYTFQYVSSAGKSSFSCHIKLDLPNLEQFIGHVAGLVKFRKSIAGQRALMTPRLREQIKARDLYTCQHCSISTRDEKNLLLEVDHKVPLARGGMTTESNLQTLCWRCNRSKGAKLLPGGLVTQDVLSSIENAAL